MGQAFQKKQIVYVWGPSKRRRNGVGRLDVFGLKDM